MSIFSRLATLLIVGLLATPSVASPMPGTPWTGPDVRVSAFASSEPPIVLAMAPVLRQANEILCKASAHFAQAELDRLLLPYMASRKSGPGFMAPNCVSASTMEPRNQRSFGQLNHFVRVSPYFAIAADGKLRS